MSSIVVSDSSVMFKLMIYTSQKIHIKHKPLIAFTYDQSITSKVGTLSL